MPVTSGFHGNLEPARLCEMRWTPDFGRADKVKPPGWEAPLSGG